MTTSVPSYSDSAIAPSPDLVLASARLANPKSREEAAAEILVEQCQQAYDELLIKASRTYQDAGGREGFIAGWGFIDSKFDNELADANHDLSRAMARLNDLRLQRQQRILAHVQKVEAKLALEAQREWRKRHGIAESERDEPA